MGGKQTLPNSHLIREKHEGCMVVAGLSAEGVSADSNTSSDCRIQNVE
jgi:hypothetical protein